MKYSRHIFLLLLFVLSLRETRAAPGWLLITPEEMKAYSDKVDEDSLSFRSMPIPSAPKIIVQIPDLTRTVRSPTDINLIFRAASGAKIKPETFQVRYGAFGFDVTDRILSRYRPDETGLIVKDAGLPPGRHLLTMTIADNMGRKGSERLEIRIAEEAQ
jgi:hypothetical protein